MHHRLGQLFPVNLIYKRLCFVKASEGVKVQVGQTYLPCKESCRCGINVPACLKVVLLFNFLSVGCIYWFVFWNTVQCNTVVFTCFVIWRFGKQNFYLRMFNVILLREWHSVSAFLAQTLCNCWPHLLLWDLFFQFWQFHEIVILQISLIWFET